MIEYRNIPDSDIPQIVEIYRQGIDSGKCTFSTSAPSAEKWDAGHMKECRIGAYDGGRLVGFVALSHQSGMRCKSGVCDLSVYIDYGYHNQGIGTELMKRIIPESEANGVWLLYAGIFCENKRSIRICEKAGFRMLGTKTKVAKDRFGVWQSTVIMEYRSSTVGID